MAQKVELVDDLQGGPAQETLRFGIDGSGYEIDLNERNARRFREEISPYIQYARRAPAGRRPRAGATVATERRHRPRPVEDVTPPPPPPPSEEPSGGPEVQHYRVSEPYVGRRESLQFARLTRTVSERGSYLTKELRTAGILLGGRGAVDVIDNVDFSFELRKTPSLRELSAVISQVDRVIRVSAALTAYTQPQLEIWTGGKLRDLRSLEAWLQTDSEEWDLEIEYLEMGSILAKLKPSGKSVKKVATDSVTVVTLLASLSTFTGVTARSFIPGTAPPAPHSVVHAGGREIPLPAPPRKNEIILHLPAGSQIKETTHLRNGKSVEWEFKVGPGGADVSGNWGQ